jgi:hypothetical protein
MLNDPASTLHVFQPQEIVTRLCQQCKTKPARHKFCGSACRQKAYRERDLGVQQRRHQRNELFRLRNRDRSLGFYGYSGPVVPGAPMSLTHPKSGGRDAA